MHNLRQNGNPVPELMNEKVSILTLIVYLQPTPYKAPYGTSLLKLTPQPKVDALLTTLNAEEIDKDKYFNHKIYGYELKMHCIPQDAVSTKLKPTITMCKIPSIEIVFYQSSTMKYLVKYNNFDMNYFTFPIYIPAVQEDWQS